MFCLVCFETWIWFAFLFALHEAGRAEGRGRQGCWCFRPETGHPLEGASNLGPEMSCEHRCPMHARQRPGGDPNENTNCTFDDRSFQTTVFTANKPKFFSAGVAGLLCRGGGSGGIPLSVPSRGHCQPGDMV